jgi:Acyclic terpene utilisation family protein AtuA
MGSLNPQRPVRIASASGAVTDRRENLAEIAKDADVDFIVGDWMSEYNMAIRGTLKSTRGSQLSDVAAFEYQFLDSFIDALPDLAKRDIKLVVNAGSCDTEKLHNALVELIKAQGVQLTVAWVEGDECLDVVEDCRAQGQKFRNITTGQLLDNWEFKPIYAQCYLGCWGIVEALRKGADIVVCGRVADAAPTMAAAAFWHDWSRDLYSELAHSLIAGHFIECSFYVTGGNFTGFKSLPQGISPLLHPPIARIQADGTFFIECHKFPGRSGEVSINTCRSQLLYELQGKRYYNSDVVAILDQIKLEQAGPDSVYVYNIGYEKPPPTTKVGLTAFGGYQAECHYFFVGLDIEEKAALLERQLRSYLKEEDFTVLKFTTSGVPASNPASQDACTVDFRIFAQAKTEEVLSKRRFIEPCWNIVMSTYPGATFAVDYRQGFPKPFNEYFVSILPLERLNHVAHIPSLDCSVKIDAPTDTVPYTFEQDIEETVDPVSLSSFGPTTTAPLGYVVHARSGDKGSDCNVGFFVRHEDEYPWLRSLLSIDFMKQLLQNDYNGKRVERFELPNIQGESGCHQIDRIPY